MANRITVTICGEDYTFMAEESLSYMQKVAALVDAKMSEIMGAGGRVSRMDAAVLAAANMADEMLKQQLSTENLDEANKAKSELSECKRELFKLQQQKK